MTCLSLFRRVEEQHAALLADAKPEGVYDSQAAEPDSLRARLQQGIASLQQGLLERGTEVLSAHRPYTLPQGLLSAYQLD